MYELPRYTVLTERGVFNNPDPESDTDWTEQVCNEQRAKLKELGYGDPWDAPTIHLFNSTFFDEATTEMTVDEALQALAIKDGADLVRFENGNIGFVAYYNGCENGFEII